MAIALVQQRDPGWSASASTNTKSTFTQNFTVGNKILIGLGIGTTGTTGCSISDNSTQTGTANTYTEIGTEIGTTTSFVRFFYCDITRAILTTDTITASWTTNGVSFMEVLEFSGAATGAMADTKTGTAATGTAISTAALTTATAGDVVVMMGMCGAAQAFTQGTDGQGNAMTLIKSSTGQSRGWGAEYRVESATSAFTPDGTIAGSTTWGYRSVRINAGVSAPTNSVAPATTFATHRVGQTATTTDGTWTGSPTFAYQWKNATDSGGTGAANATGSGATTATYTSNYNDFGKYLACTVTATNAGGSLAVAGNYLGPAAGNFAASNVVNGRIEICGNDVHSSLFTQGSVSTPTQTGGYYLQMPVIPAFVAYYGS